MEKLPVSDAQESVKSLMVTIDDKLFFYLRRRAAEYGKPAEHGRPMDDEIKSLFEILKKKSFTTVLREVFAGEVDFDSAEPLDEAALKELLLDRFKKFADIFLDRNRKYWHEKDAAPVINGARALFGDERFTMRMLALLTDFIEHEYFKEEQDVQSTQQTEKVRCLMKCKFVLACIQITLARSELENDKVNIILNAVLIAIESIKEPSALTTFLDLVAEIFAETTSFEVIHDFFHTRAAVSWTRAQTEDRFRLCVFGKGEEKWSRIVSRQNFYFTDACDTEQEYVDEQFPPQGNLVEQSDYCTLVGEAKDISVFRSDGQKIFWGDLLERDITKLQGPYYVLSQIDSVFEVPEFAKLTTAIGPAEDPHRPPVSLASQPRDVAYIDRAYMQIMALGKIKNGKFIPNARHVKITPL